MRHLKPSDYRAMPWKNGKGTTTEIAAWPPGASLSGTPFTWRLSIADVAESGPFSQFPGYDRTIMVIAGDGGMWLDGGPDGAIDLTRPFEPRQFSGDWAVNGRLVAGPLRDFNLMVARSEAVGSMSVVSDAGPVRVAAPEEGFAALVVFKGRVDLTGTGPVTAGDTLLLDSRESVQAVALPDESGGVRMALIAIEPVAADRL